MKLNTTAKEIQQVNPGGPDKSSKYLEVEFKASITSVWLLSDRDNMKLSYSGPIQRQASGTNQRIEALRQGRH